jgi:predicted nucleic acid-binding Zn ribbon protein
MAANSNQKTLGEAIRELLERYNLEGKLGHTRVIQTWEEVAGEMISRHTREMYFKGNKLFVRLDSPALKNELSYSKRKIIDALNEKVGAVIVADIVFI